MEFGIVRAALRKCEVFSGFDDAQLGFLMNKGEIREFSEGDIIYEKDTESGGSFCLIASGSINIISENGQILQTMGPGEVIGEIGSISPRHRRTVRVEAARHTEALEWDIEDIQDNLPGLLPKLKDLAWKRLTNWYE